MTKRLLVLMTIVLMLVGFSSVQAQPATVSAQQVFVLTDGPINTELGFIMSDGRVCNPRTMLC